MGELLRRDAGAVVPDADDALSPLLGDGHVDTLSAAAVLGRIVQQIAEHLTQPPWVSGDGDHLLRALGILQSDALLAEELPVGVHRVLQFRFQIQRLHRQGEAAVLNAGELQQLLHHVGQPVGLRHDDVHPFAHVARVLQLTALNRLRPAGDGGERGAQLVGDGRNKLRLGLFRLLDLQRHVIDGVCELSDLVIELLLDLDAVAAVRNEAGRLVDAGQRLHDGTHEIQVREIHHSQNGDPDQGAYTDGQEQLPVHRRHRGDEPDHAHCGPLVDDRGGHGHDPLPCLGVLSRPGLHIAALHGAGDVRRPRHRARGGQAVAGTQQRTVCLDELHLQLLLIRKFCYIVLGCRPVLPPGVDAEAPGRVRGPGGEVVPHGPLIVRPQGQGERSHGQQQDQGHHAHAVHQPALPDAPDLHPVLDHCLLRHRIPPLRSGAYPRCFLRFIRSTCTHIPTRW